MLLCCKLRNTTDRVLATRLHHTHTLQGLHAHCA